ncbi:class I SAM-dependent methyltransferase [Halanaerobaculum tunisiense]
MLVKKTKTKVNLLQIDVQDSEFEAEYFDIIVSSYVFCSVPDLVQGFKELKRVCKPEGKNICVLNLNFRER